jgi:hypothetical protein
MIVGNNITLSVCEDNECRCVHVVIGDGTTELASAALPVRSIPEFIRHLQAAAYHVITLKESP